MKIRKTNKSLMKYFILLCLLVFRICLSHAQSEISIIPYPNSVELHKGTLDLNRVALRITGNSNHALYLQELLAECNIYITPTNDKSNLPIHLIVVENTLKNAESYELKVTKSKIEIKAPTETGVFYGIQSLSQLLSVSTKIPLLTIKDEPVFKWRAFMLDEARYYKGAKEVKNILCEMARLKLNVFHWHLTNDEGWRIEIKKYPLLTEVGSKRDSSQVGTWPDGWKSTIYDGKSHEGFYTQEQIKEIIQYAAERHITIVPEVSMPGHANAAIAAYPWLGLKKDTTMKVPTEFGMGYDIFDVSSARVRQFLRNVLEEVLELFPSKFIHIGGDEVHHDHWKKSSNINAFMKKNGILSYAELQV